MLVNRLIKGCGDDVGLLMLLVDFKNTFNLVDREARTFSMINEIDVLGGDAGLAGVFPPNIAQPIHGVKLLNGPASVDFDFCNELVTKRVAKTVVASSFLYGYFYAILYYMHMPSPCLRDLVTGNGGFPPYPLHFKGSVSILQGHSGPIFDDALCVFNTSAETDLLSYPMALWKSQREDHTSDWLRRVPIFGLGQTMNACSRVFYGDIYGDHTISIMGIKNRHNAVCGLDVCVNLTGSSPLTQTGMADFVLGRAVIDVVQRKRVKYMAKSGNSPFLMTLGHVLLFFSIGPVSILIKEWVPRISPCKELDIRLGRGRDRPLHPADMMLYSCDEGLDVCKYKANAPLTPLVKPRGGIRPIVVGIIWRRLVFKVSATMIGHSLDGYLNDQQFGVGVSGGGEAILHVVNHLIEDRREEIRDSFNLSFQAWYLDDGTINEDTLAVGEVLKVIMEDGPRHDLHLNVDKTEVFLPKEDPRSRFAGVF
nr:ABC transporter A family member 9-like [Tanacetum cinerariifolium]